MLALCTLTNVTVVAAPIMAMPVLFPEISLDLNLSLVQIGLVWAISALPNLITSLYGGAAGDRFGPRRVILICCLLSGLFGGLRGLAHDFPTLLAGMLAAGMVTPLIIMNNLKTIGLWFKGRELVIAGGVLSMGMALGFMLGSLVSASLLSPLFGGWRGVMFFYALLAFGLALPWRFAPAAPGERDLITPSIRGTIGYVVRLRGVWLLGLVLLGFSGGIQGALGYLPLYLRSQGWAGARADLALSTFHTVSMLLVLPISLGAARMPSRRPLIWAAGGLATAGLVLMSVAQGPLVWAAVVLSGMMRDGFMAIFMTEIIETEGVGPQFAGTAIGLAMLLSAVGNLIAPPLGNALAAIAPGAPFVFWAGLLGVCLLAFAGVRAASSAEPARQSTP